MRIDASQNVGIGETAPLGNLHVASGTGGGSPNAAADEFIIEGAGAIGMTFMNDNTSSSNIYFADGDSAWNGALFYDHVCDYMAFYANAAEAMRLDSSQQVGIGTTAPTGGFDSWAATNYFSDAQVAHGMTGLAPTTAYGAVIPYSGTQGGLIVRGLADGDAATLTALQLDGMHGHASPTQTVMDLRVGKANGTSWQALGADEIAIQFTNYTTKMLTVLGSGEIGIGTATPGQALDVVGNIQLSGCIIELSGQDLTFCMSSNRDFIWSDGSELMRLNGDEGKLGIGTNPSESKLEISVPNNDYAFRVVSDTDDNYKAQISNEAEIGIFKLYPDGSTGSCAGFMASGAGLTGINEMENGSMTQGLTINQGANDNHILALKSSDVSYGTIDVHEADSYFDIHKVSGHANGGLVGGVQINAMTDDSSASNQATMKFVTYADDAYTNTSESTSSVGMVDFMVLQHDSAGSYVAPSTGEILYTLRAWNGSYWATKFIVNMDGDISYDGSDAGAFDLWDDAPLLRTVALETMDPKTLVRSRWDEMVQYNKEDLVAAGLLGKVSPEEEAQGIRPLVNATQMQRALVGEAWQGYCRDMELAEKVEELQNKNALLEQRLKLLEN